MTPNSSEAMSEPATFFIEQLDAALVAARVVSQREPVSVRVSPATWEALKAAWGAPQATSIRGLSVELDGSMYADTFEIKMPRMHS